ncbi:UV-B-induced protein At3g17800 [Durusdinium trenchii]|uniref:Chloroplastic n=1 Tax=Durusdinium trenchii TaxID=1381693 RepID=A0ABP0L8Y2_9DINO
MSPFALAPMHRRQVQVATAVLAILGAFRASQLAFASSWSASSWREDLVRQKVLLGRGCEALLRAAEEGDAPATLWSPGPVKLETKAARRVQKHLQHDPLLVLVDETVKEEFKLLAVQRLKQESPITSPPGAVGEALGLMSLRRRIAQIQRKERLKTASELIYVMVASMFKYLEVPFIQPLKGGGHVRMDMDGEQLRGLTEIYSMEALELVRDHLFNIVGVEAQAAEAPALRIAMYQAGQVYAMSALFGYYLRRADVRYQLDKIVSLHDAGDDNDDLEIGETRKRRRRPVPRWMELSWAKGESRADVSLKDYIQSFGPDELRQIRSLASAEAQATMELQISALFGDLRVLKSKLLKATEGSTTDEEATEMLEEGLRSGAVESIRISYDNLRRLILEAVAFGSVLFDAAALCNKSSNLQPKSDGQRPNSTNRRTMASNLLAMASNLIAMASSC